MTQKQCGQKPQNRRKPPQILEIRESPFVLDADPIKLRADVAGRNGRFVRPVNPVVRNVGRFIAGLSVQTGIWILQLSRFVLEVLFWGVRIVHAVLMAVIPVVLPWLIGLSVLLTIAYGLATVIRWVLSQSVFWTGLAVAAGLAYAVWMAGLFLSVRRRKSRKVGNYESGSTVVNIINQVTISGKTIVNIFTQIIKND